VNAVLNTGWEIAQLPLYTLWEDDSLPFIAYAVLLSDHVWSLEDIAKLAD